MANYFNIDPSLVLRLKNGDENALNEILQQSGPKVFNYCKKQVTRVEDAEELLQDIFLKIWQFRASIDVNANFEVLLFTIARNHIINFARKRAGYALTATGDLERFHENGADDHQQLSYKQVQRQYKQILEKLGTKRREVFEMSREQGLSNKEIAEKMGISVRTVETHVSHVLTILRSELKDNYVLLFLFYTTDLSSLLSLPVC